MTRPRNPSKIPTVSTPRLHGGSPVDCACNRAAVVEVTISGFAHALCVECADVLRAALALTNGDEVRWYASGAGIARTGPFTSAEDDRAAMRLMPRPGVPSRPRVVTTPTGGFGVVMTTAQHEIGTDCYPADMRVWSER